MGEWRECNLDEIYEFASGLSKPRSEFGSGYPFLSFKDVFYNYFVPGSLESLVKTDERERQRCSVRRGDVFLTRTSETMNELGMSCVALRDVPEATFNGFTKRLRPKREDAVLPEYAGYFFRSRGFREDVMSMTTMSTRASLNNEMLARLKIKLPPLSVQSAIGSMLLSLDDKIELNRRMNETLEAMARALFKDWFVDFGPTRAKMDVREPYLAPHLWDLFPDTLDDEGKPEGWKTATLDFFTDLQNGYAFKSKDWREIGVPVVKIGSVKSSVVDLNQVSYIDHELADEKSNFRLNQGDMLVGLTGYVGETGRIPPTDILPMLNQRVGRFLPSKAGVEFVYACVRRPEFKEFAELKAYGSAQANVSTKDLLAYPLVNPGQEVISSFCKIASPLFEKMLTNLGLASSLAQTRDLLLPKLMSGEIRLRDAEKLAEEAA